MLLLSLLCSAVMHVGHGELSEGNVELPAPDGEVAHVMDGGLLRRQQQHDVLLVVGSDDGPHLWVGSR
jgi:hypothetical protein